MIAKKEGKLKQVSIGNVREILKCLVDMQTDFNVLHGDVIDGPLYELVARSESDYKKAIKKKQ